MRIFQKKLFRDLKVLKVQIFSLATLVICAVSIIVSSWSAYRALEKAKDNYYGKYNFSDIFVEFEKASADLMNRVNQINGVEHAEGRIVEDALVEVLNQPEPAIGRFISWNENSLINQIYLKQGLFPEVNSLQDVVVHESFAVAHKLRVGDKFGVLFKGLKQQLTVCGIGISPEYVFALSPVSFFPDNKHFGIFWMDKNALEKLAQMQGAINSIVLKISKTAVVGDIKARLDILVNPYGSLGSYDRTKQLSHIFLQDEIQQQRSSATVIPFIFVMVGAFILNIVMNRLVSLHRGQISILKALGYSSKDLTLYYWKLATVVLTVGVIPSFIIAHWIGRWYASQYEQFFRFPQIDFALTTDSLILGLAAGFIPGWLATLKSLVSVFKLSPAEGMRPPLPPAFHKTALVSWSGLKSRNIMARMVFRDLLLHPLRTLSAVIGIAAAVAVLVNGSFWIDIVNFMLKRQFQEMNREDVEVHFYNPRKMDVINEVAKIPGIIYIEAARVVPVRMSYKNYSKDTALVAFEKQIEMRQVLNREGQVLQIPEQGVIMSEYFRKKYALKAGTPLSFQLIRKPTVAIEAPLLGFIDDLLGANVYINFKTLHSILGEEPSVDSLFLKIDPKIKEQIYVKLKQSPIVASVTVKSLMIKSFRDTTMKMIMVFTSILILFAVAISGAVLFNISRIILAEKSWELASLRILGFNIFEVFNLIYVQLGIQVLIAAAPGLLLGYALSYISTAIVHSEAFSFPLIIETRTYALAISTIFFTYLIGGRFLFKRIRDLNLTEALKERE